MRQCLQCVVKLTLILQLVDQRLQILRAVVGTLQERRIVHGSFHLDLVRHKRLIILVDRPTFLLLRGQSKGTRRLRLLWLDTAVHIIRKYFAATEYKSILRIK